MPVSPALAESLARTLVDRYARAERLLLARVARNLAKGIDAPFWVERKLAQMQAYRAQAEAMVAALDKAAARGVREAITLAYERGGLAAVADLNKLGLTTVESLAGQRAIERLTAETLGYVTSTHSRILRETMDLYRSIIAETSTGVLTGTQTRRQAAQSALDAFAKKGITGFIDASGRGWNLQSYVEMATRTGCGRAAVQGHIDRLSENGIGLVIVSDAPKECGLCRPWEGRVLSIGGLPVEMPAADNAVPTLDEFAAQLGDVGPDGRAIGPLDVRAYRVGKTDQQPIFLAGNRLDAEDYRSLHGGAEVVEYLASMKNAYAINSYGDLAMKLNKWKPVNSQIQAQKLVYSWLRKQGYDGVIILTPNAATAKTSRELVVFLNKLLKRLG